MRRSADGAPASADGSVRMHLQPGRGADSEDEELPADEQLDRMLGDKDLLLRLQLSGYAEKYWDPAAWEFARYGLDVMRAWCRNGRIFTEVYRKTHHELRRPDDQFDDDAVETLATDTVVAAIDGFLEHVLKKNRWDPSGGASLKTYFIGQCCFQFSNAFKSWWRAEKRLGRLRRAADAIATEKMSSDLPEGDAAAILGAEVSEAMNLLSSAAAREAFAMNAAGYSHAEIAEQLGLADEKAVENLLGYQRRRIAKMKERAG